MLTEHVLELLCGLLGLGYMVVAIIEVINSRDRVLFLALVLAASLYYTLARWLEKITSSSRTSS